jgi:hypothetical protein
MMQVWGPLERAFVKYGCSNMVLRVSCKGPNSMFNDIAAVCAALVGVAGSVTAAILSVRNSQAKSRRRAYLRSLVPRKEMQSYQMMLDEFSDSLDESTRSRYLDMLVECYIEDKLTVQSTDGKADVHKAKVSKPIAEVERSDGSTVAIEFDSSDARSIRSFLNTVRQQDGERILAIH